MAFAGTLPAKVNVDEVLGTLHTRGAFTRAALDLYDECRLLIDAVARQHEPERITSRERAIGCGLLVRLSKFMFATATLVRNMGRCGEIVKALNRCQMESAINLLVLLKRNSPEAYTDFVAAGLGPEKEFYDVIHANIAAHEGIQSPMEDGMLRSIERVVTQSGMAMNDVRIRHHEWGGNMRDKMAEVWDGLYTAYRVSSHAVHGTWADLLMSHLEWAEDGYAVESTFDLSDSRLLNPIARMNLEALGSYCSRWLPPEYAEQALLRIEDLIERSEQLSEVFEGWLAQRQTQSGIAR